MPPLPQPDRIHKEITVDADDVVGIAAFSATGVGPEAVKDKVTDSVTITLVAEDGRALHLVMMDADSVRRKIEMLRSVAYHLWPHETF
jgi:hypothetical protein